MVPKICNNSILLLIIFFQAFISPSQQYGLKKQGPIFIYQPPSQVDFLNSTGASIDCSAHGNPDPIVEWETIDGNVVRKVNRLLSLPQNGSLVFIPFKSELYDQKIHSGVYRCVAYNKHGRIISRNVQVRAVVDQPYEVQVYNEFVIRGNTAVMQCQVPSFVTDYVEVMAWIRDDNVVIRNDNMDEAGRYSVFSNGKLHIRNVRPSDQMGYWCQTRHKLTNIAKLSSNKGQLEVKDSGSAIPPRFTDIMPSMHVWMDEKVEIPCAAQGNPTPKYRWFIEKDLGVIAEVDLSNSMKQKGGSLVIDHVKFEDSANYLCEVKNSAGSQRATTILSVQERLEVFIDPQNIVVDSGKEVIMNCSVSGAPINEIYWTKNGRRIDGGRYQILGRKMLVIQSARREDEGMYQCFVKNNIEVATGATQLLLGNVAPHFVIKHHENILQPGSTVSLRCGANGDPLPTIYWYLDNVRLNNTAKTQIKTMMTEEGLTLTMLNTTNAKSLDGGEYKCLAKNSVGSASHSASIHIYGPPRVRKMPNITAISGEYVTMKCYVAGYPIDKIYWTRDGLKLSLERTAQDNNGMLTIKNVQKMVDDGRYTCNAKNKIGQRSSSSIWLKIIVAPVLGPMPSHSTEEGNGVVMTCSISAGDPPFGIVWLWNNKPLPHSVGITLTNMGDLSLLQITSVHLVHEGNYTCLVTNAAGSSNQTASIRVKSPPVWLIKPSNLSVAVRSKVLINCTAYGYPKPIIRWKFLSATPWNVKKFEVLKNGSLLIRNTSYSQKGEYMCEARNGIAPNQQLKILLIVGAEPVVDISPINISVVSGEIFELKCRVEADGATSLLWYKKPHNRLISNSNRVQITHSHRNNVYLSILKMRPIFTYESGLYSCHIINAFKNASKDALVEVKEGAVILKEEDVTLAEETSEVEKEKNDIFIIIPIASASVTIIVLFVVIIICLRRKKTHHREQNNEVNESNIKEVNPKIEDIEPKQIYDYTYKDSRPPNVGYYGNGRNEKSQLASYHRYSSGYSNYASTSPYATFQLTGSRSTPGNSTELRTFGSDCIK